MKPIRTIGDLQALEKNAKRLSKIAEEHEDWCAYHRYHGMALVYRDWINDREPHLPSDHTSPEKLRELEKAYRAIGEQYIKVGVEDRAEHFFGVSEVYGEWAKEKEGLQ